MVFSMTVEEMKQRLAALKRERDSTPNANRQRLEDIREEMYYLQGDINKASEEAEAAEAAVKSFRLRVIDTARQTWIHTPEDDKTDMMLKWAFEGAEYFERAADNYLATGKNGETK